MKLNSCFSLDYVYLEASYSASQRLPGVPRMNVPRGIWPWGEAYEVGRDNAGRAVKPKNSTSSAEQSAKECVSSF